MLCCAFYRHLPPSPLSLSLSYNVKNSLGLIYISHWGSIKSKSGSLRHVILSLPHFWVNLWFGSYTYLAFNPTRPKHTFHYLWLFVLNFCFTVDFIWLLVAYLRSDSDGCINHDLQYLAFAMSYVCSYPTIYNQALVGDSKNLPSRESNKEPFIHSTFTARPGLLPIT